MIVVAGVKLHIPATHILIYTSFFPLKRVGKTKIINIHMWNVILAFKF